MSDAATDGSADAPGRRFRVLIVPGVNPDRWLRVWRERLADVPLDLVHAEPRDAERVLRDGGADVALVRLPVDRDGLSVIPLYTEATVVVSPRDHVFAVADEVLPHDLADETVIRPDDDLLGWTDVPGTPFTGGAVPTTADAIELVAAGVGVVVLPQSVARLHHRRTLVARPVVDAPGSSVGLAWVTDAHDDLTEEFIGIVRGRTAASSRGRGSDASAPTSAGKGASPARGASSGKGGTTKVGGTAKGGTSKGSTSKGSTPKGGTSKGGGTGRGKAPGRGRPRRGR